MHDPIQRLRETLPPQFARTEVRRLTGGLIAPQTLANATAKGEDPPHFKFNGRVGYEREAFCDWLAGRQKRAQG